MSDNEQGAAEPKPELEANAPISVKVSLSRSRSTRRHLAPATELTSPSQLRTRTMIQVVSSSGDEVFFKIKRNTKLTKLQGAYANKVGKDIASIR